MNLTIAVFVEISALFCRLVVFRISSSKTFSKIADLFITWLFSRFSLSNLLRKTSKYGFSEIMLGKLKKVDKKIQTGRIKI